MDFELTADIAAVVSFGRLKTLTGSRDGRPRSHGVRLVWHDSPEHALLGAGLSLCEQRGVWRLERILPGAATWLPAQPAPVVAEAPDPASLPSPLAPLAAFEGRRTNSLHRFGDAAVTLTVDKGVLRAVTAERPIARILLSGDEAAVRAAALLLADASEVAVPHTSLAAEAIALAVGRPMPVRHSGAPLLPEVIVDAPNALAHILGHLTDVILANTALAVRLDDAGSEGVHQMRVAVRRARSALSVFRPAVPSGVLDDVGASLKALGNHLGPSRDWDVLANETIAAIRNACPDDQRLDRLAAAVARRQRACRQALAGYLAGREFRQLGIQLAWFSAATGWHEAALEPAGSLDRFAAIVLQQRFRKLVSAGKRMPDLDIPGLHAVRLRAKRLRYAAEIFATLFRGKSADRFIRRLSVLQQRLGVLNDGAVASHLLEELGGAGGRHAYAAGLVAGFMAARAGRMRPRIVTAFDKVRKQPEFWA